MYLISSMVAKALLWLPPELAHLIGCTSLKIAYKLGLIKPLLTQSNPYQYHHLAFKNKVGLAAGFDKNGDYIDELSALGFSHIEIGTLTPKPQSGNPKPRIFRSKKNLSLINRMGFNNKGIDYAVNILKNRKKTDSIIGVNIGKNRDTPIEMATSDYLICLEKIYQYADYLAINISSPNTKGLRDLHHKDHLSHLLSQLKRSQHQLSQKYSKLVPIFLKLAPDLSEQEQISVLECVKTHQIEGLIISNTTLDRPDQLEPSLTSEAGGLSGKLLTKKSTDMLPLARKILPQDTIIIGVGGIMNIYDAREKLDRGADIVQIYTGFVYNSFGLLKELSSL